MLSEKNRFHNKYNAHDQCSDLSAGVDIFLHDYHFPYSNFIRNVYGMCEGVRIARVTREQIKNELTS
jgi:hypothetical protein